MGIRNTMLDLNDHLFAELERLSDEELSAEELDKEIKEYCNERLAEYKWIRIVEFTDAMPKTISGKIRKAEQREAAMKA